VNTRFGKTGLTRARFLGRDEGGDSRHRG
jgi:hypothetical protein